LCQLLPFACAAMTATRSVQRGRGGAGRMWTWLLLGDAMRFARDGDGDGDGDGVEGSLRRQGLAHRRRWETSRIPVMRSYSRQLLPRSSAVNAMRLASRTAAQF